MYLWYAHSESVVNFVGEIHTKEVDMDQYLLLYEVNSNSGWSPIAVSFASLNNKDAQVLAKKIVEKISKKDLYDSVRSFELVNLTSDQKLKI